MAENNIEDDCNEQHLQSDWRALASASFRHKIFVKSSGTEDQKDEKLENNKPAIEIGESVSGYYQEVLQMPSTAVKEPPAKRKRKELSRKVNIEKVSFRKENMFRLATNNSVEEIQQLLTTSTNVDLNAKDNFGWTALMMAACENSVDAFRLLLECGADLSVKDRTGNSAVSLARRNKHQEILSAIEEYQNEQEESDSSADDDQKEENGTEICPDCKIEISRSSSKSHRSSTIHLFSCKYNSNPKIKSFGIAHSNRGFKMMKTIGWDGNSALGARKNGKLYPVKTVMRHKRTGLGVKQGDARITHFKAHDVRAVHFKSQPHAPTRKEIIEQVEKDKRKERMLRRELS
jgi:hypothetical protein